MSISDTLWLPCTQMQTLDNNPPLKIVRAKGVYLYDDNNNAYIDAISSWWVNIHGHCHDFINDYIKQQLDTLAHTLLASVYHPSIESLAEQLVHLSPTGLNKAFFADSGSASIECALKMSLQYWHQSQKVATSTHKKTFVSLEHGYHGETLGSLAVTDIPLFSKQYAPLLIKHHRIASPADLFCPNEHTQSQYETAVLAELETCFINHADEICAFILEPLVQGACGMGMYSANFLTQAKALCEKYHIHLIADEIAVGFGRTGTMFACEQANITPDFMCLSKGLTAGYLPMSCVLTTNEIYEAFLADDFAKGFLHSHSFTGNPLASASALASLALFQKEDVLTQNQIMIQHMQDLLNQLCVNNQYIGQPRQTGMISAFTVIQTGLIGHHISQYARQKSVFVRPIGNHVYIMPPYCITKAQLTQVFEVLHEAINFAVKQVPQKPIDPKLLA